MAQLVKVLLVGRSQSLAQTLNQLGGDTRLQINGTKTNAIGWFYDGKMHMYAGKQDIGDFDIIVTNYREESIMISKFIAATKPELKTIVVNSRECEYSSSKHVQYLDLYRMGLPFPKTIYAYSLQNLQEILQENNCFQLPLIVKANRTSHGNDNYLFKSWAEISDFFAQNDIREYIIQEYIPNNFDYRVFIFGENYCVSKKERHTGTGHRNNVALGAEESIVEDLNAAILKDCFKAVKSAGVTHAGVDVVVDKQTGTHYILEVNVNSPGITLDQAQTHEVKVLFKSLAELLPIKES